MFRDHTYYDSTWCWARDCDEFVHKAIIDKMKESTIETNQIEHIVTGIDDRFVNVACDSVGNGLGGERNNEEDNVDNGDVDMEVEWAEALNVTFDAMGDRKDLMESDDGSAEKWRPEGVLSDDESSVEDGGDVTGTIDDLVVEEMKYEVAICDDLENYGIEQTVFNEGELSDIRRKERILMERGDKGYYRCKLIHKTAYAKITQTLRKYMTDENLQMLHHPFTTQSKEALNKNVSAYAPKH